MPSVGAVAAADVMDAADALPGCWASVCANSSSTAEPEPSSLAPGPAATLSR